MAFVRLSALVACALALAGCAFGQAEDSAEITDDQLAVMVLPQAELRVPAGFELDPKDSGPISAREAAEATTDPDDNAADIRQAGWLGGYELTYSEPAGNVSFARGEGVVFGDSTVQLFDTETSARARLLQEMRDLERFRGKVLNGVRLARFETFDVNVGDEAWGIELTARARGVTLHGTGVLFRSGRLVADTGFLHLDQAGRRGEALAAARALEARIQHVLAGDLDAQPVRLPAKEAAVTRAQLARMTLSLKDLPAGARLDAEGRAPSGGGAVSYYRTFDVEDTMVGSSHLLFVRAQTQVFEKEADAARMLRLLQTPDGRGYFAKVVLRGFEKLVGARARNAQVRALQGGDTGIVVTFDMPGGRFRTVTVFTRSGRSVATVSGFCTAHAVHPGDLPPLGDKARARLASVPV
jgi:hypothetical protein